VLTRVHRICTRRRDGVLTGRDLQRCIVSPLYRMSTSIHACRLISRRREHRVCLSTHSTSTSPGSIPAAVAIQSARSACTSGKYLERFAQWLSSWAQPFDMFQGRLRGVEGSTPIQGHLYRVDPSIASHLAALRSGWQASRETILLKTAVINSGSFPRGAA
jgi:hypothetical protein